MRQPFHFYFEAERIRPSCTDILRNTEKIGENNAAHGV